ncbi:MAG TPA: DUF4397 domain-containing protein [Gammaproteobacteria bacterium]|nr:DUF4397 domain-containing protein [Gammaproteobacteria bacterium]
MNKQRRMAAFGAALGLGLGAGIAAADETGFEIYVVHGIPGEDVDAAPMLPVDVSVQPDGGEAICAVENLMFGDITGPLSLPAGSYNVMVWPANVDEPCSGSTLIEADIDFEAGESYSVVAHLEADGDITASSFENTFTTETLGDKEVLTTVRHLAAAPAVDVRLERLGTEALLEGLENGDEVSAPLRRGRWDAAVLPAGGDAAVFAAELPLAAQTAQFVYAVGSLTNDTFTLLTQTLPVPMAQAADVYVVHGIAGLDLDADAALPVDVAVNGECAIEALAFTEIVGPLPLPAGHYDIDVSLADADAPCSNASVIDVDGLAIEAGASLSIAAHLDAAGSPVAAAFDNPQGGTLSPVPVVDVRHAAAFGAVDVGLQRIFLPVPRTVAGLTNGEAAEVNVLPGLFAATLAPADAAPVLVAGLPVRALFDYAVYAVGTPGNDTLQFLVQRLPR